MLRLHLTGRRFNVATGWEFNGKRWASPCGYLEPFRHEAIEHHMMAADDGSAAFLMVRERAAGNDRFPASQSPQTLPSDSFRQYRRRAADWPLGFVIVDLAAAAPPEDGRDRRDEAGQVRVTCGPTSAAPLQLAVHADTLHGSWDLLDLSALWSPDRLNVTEVTRFLCYRVLYSTATMFQDVRTLTERATAVFDGNALEITYPGPAEHARPRELREGADPVAVFERLLAEVTGRWRAEPGRMAVELSGGMDSAAVAVALADLYGDTSLTGRAGDRALTEPSVRTAVLRLPGEAGDQQMTRRAEMIDVLGLGPDHVVPVTDHAPFAPGGSRRSGVPFSPLDGNYVEATILMQQQLADAGVTTVFTGAAGDDLLDLRPEERQRLNRPKTVRPLPGWLGPQGRDAVPRFDEGPAPAPVLKYSTLTGLEPRFPQTMRQGLWPVSPLATPELLRLCEQLPTEWRRRKRLIREHLARRGMSERVVWPVLRENFAPVMETAMRRWGVPLLSDLIRRGSLLADHGIIDADAVLDMCDDARAGGPVEQLSRPLVMEASLRSVCGT